ncbi:hypothetical protein DY000_02017443 [Brassica cretica]|uniref:Polygalacturonase n=1 Tax=Brassica cretica TaxID=69181 RepID=A0ABQ7CPR7_BRACR|nr:hypothetical protein DY000_02017443 [Brassica cretica]
MSSLGPCANQIEFVIDGTLLAPSNPRAIKKDTWIHSRYISNLIISGADTHDGQGKVSWPLNDCHKNPSCPKLASPNTDWLKFRFCSNINISKTHIGTGDDCIGILSGTTNMDISNVNCGPGHGISVGSLGKNKEEKNVNGLIVRDIVFNGTSDGIGIKTWESSASKILVSNFVYENIQMINVGNPINMDQKETAHVQIQDLKLKNIYGTSTNKVAVNLQCSKSFPCKKVELIDINLEHKGVEAGPSTAVNKEKKETKEHYRSILRLVKEQTQHESGWNEASNKVKSISSQIDLLDVIIKAENFDFVAELEKLTAEHIDWPKLRESWMDD